MNKIIKKLLLGQEEILNNLTLEEKAALCQGATFWTTKAIPEKDIPAITVSDGPHGLRKQMGAADHMGVNISVPATCFPSSSAICNSWDETLIFRVGEALGEECLQEDISVLLGPGANIKRSPLCGRNFEYFSEDPFLSAHMAKSHIRGVQSKGVGTSLKHFAVNNQETRRMTVDACIDERTLREIYLASFEAAVKEAKPWTVMAAYNKVNGSYCCENEHLLKDILREEWGYEGVVVSDWGAANDPVAGIPNGFDLRMPYGGEKFNERIVAAVKSGTLKLSDLDAAVRRLLTLIRRGEECRRPGSLYNKMAHHALAETAAMESAVLLKNNNNVLPIEKGESVAIIGGLAKNIRFQGSGSSHINPTVTSDIITAFSQLYPQQSYSFARGYRLKKDVIDEAFVAEALANAQNAHKILLRIGLPDGWESEGFDRKHLRLPNNQIDLIQRLHRLGKPVIAVLFAGAPVEMPWIDEVDALFAMYTAGQAMPSALAKLAMGDANPCGKLAETYPIKLSDTPCSLTYPQKEVAVYQEGIFVGYRYYEKKEMAVRFAFGHGLSYTCWTYSRLKTDKDKMSDAEQLTVTVDVENTGNIAGKEIIQLYVRDLQCKVPRPIKELKGFTKIYCEPGEKKTVTFVLDKRSFAYYNVDISDWYVDSGRFEILVGAGSDDIRLTTEVFVESTTVIKKHYDAYITMDELSALPAGQEFMKSMMQQAAPELTAMPASEELRRKQDDEDDVDDIPMDLGAMGMDMPLIKVADMMAGALSDEMVQMLVDAINA